MSKRVLKEVIITYKLASPMSLSQATQEKRWFFELPESRDHHEGWKELLYRIFYNCNCTLGEHAPGDRGWFAVVSFVSKAVDSELVLTWDGQTTAEAAEDKLPWCFIPVVWEPAVCWYVDEQGQYDALDINAYSELIAYRALAEGKSEQLVQAFLQKLYPPNWQEIWQNRAERLRSIACIREPLPFTIYRKPDEKPWLCGPPLI